MRLIYHIFCGADGGYRESERDGDAGDHGKAGIVVRISSQFILPNHMGNGPQQVDAGADIIRHAEHILGDRIAAWNRIGERPVRGGHGQSGAPAGTGIGKADFPCVLIGAGGGAGNAAGGIAEPPVENRRGRACQAAGWRRRARIRH